MTTHLVLIHTGKSWKVYTENDNGKGDFWKTHVKEYPTIEQAIQKTLPKLGITVSIKRKEV